MKNQLPPTYYKRNIFFTFFLMIACSLLINAQDGFTVTGNIADEFENPLPGASIVEQGTTNGTQADFDGNFSITVKDGNAILLISYIGYATDKISVNNQLNITAILKESAAGLDEVVVIGYGTKLRKDLTGAITSVTTKQLQQRAVVNVAEALRGRVPGLTAPVSTSPDGSTNLQIRGQNSFGTAGASNDPLIVLDGQIFYGNLADINPIDVISIDVLKDASSAAIFGARSSAGVIMVTTKKGAKGKTTINVSSSVGIVKLTNHPNFRSPQGYLDFRVDASEALAPNTNAEYYVNPTTLSNVDINTWRNYNAGNASLSDNEIWFQRLNLNSLELQNYEAGRTINWFDEVTQVGFRRENSVSVSGASEKTSHYFSIGHTNNDGFIVGENFEAIRTRFNLESSIMSFLKVGANIQFSHDNNAPVGANQPGFLIANHSQARYASPFGSKFNEDGSLKLEPHNDLSARNPFLFQNSSKDSRDDNLVGNIFTEVQLPWGFKYRLNWINSMRWYHNLDFERTVPEQQGAGGSRRNFSSYTWNIDNILTWEKQFGTDHNVDVTLLYNSESQENFGQRATNTNFVPSEILGFHQLNFGGNPNIINDDSAYTANAQMGRVNYGYKGKYLLTGSIRRDGYSAFGENNKSTSFMAGAFAWNVSEESFLENVKWLDLLKFRVSWGENGNRSIPLYRSLAGLGTVQYMTSNNGSISGASGFSGSRLSNPNLKWERTESLNVGFDFSLYSGKLSGSVEYYTANTTDLLVERALPNVTGFSNILSNLGELRNSGVELSLNAQLVDSPNFAWNSNLIYATNKNEIKSLYGDIDDIVDTNGNVIGQKLADDTANRRFIGQPIDVIFDYELGNVYTTDEADEAARFGLVPGDFRVIDQNGNGSINSIEDQKFLGQTTPKHNMTFTNDFTLFKDFQLSISLNGQFGHKGLWNGRFGGGHGPNDSWMPLRLNGYDYPYWTPDNQLSNWARIGSSNIYGASSYDSKSFMRIQNITFGYDLPNKVTDLLNVVALKFSVDLSNVAIFTDWKYYDPERTGSAVPFVASARLLLTL